MGSKVALVTWAASGLGFATANAFAEAGTALILSDLNEDSCRLKSMRYGAKVVNKETRYRYVIDA